jgi:voltage-gated potassium channel
MKVCSKVSALYAIPWQRLAVVVAAALTAVAIGTIGFHQIEGFSFLDAAYASVQTVTTVGYGDVAPKTAAGKSFAIVLMLTGVGLVLYALTVTAQSVLRSEILEVLSERRRIKAMKKLSGHYIVCGAGRVGRRIVRTLEREGKPYVIIESDPSKFPDLKEHGRLIVGDATSEECLLQAGVESATGLASCLPDDAANVYVVLTARGLNEHLHIVARAVEEQAESTLIRAGANRVVAPTIIGSQSMARSLTKPAIADLMDSIAAETLDLAFEEVSIGRHSPFAGKTLRETNLITELNLIVVTIRRKGGELIFHPKSNSLIYEGDLLIVVGKADSLKRVMEINRG